MSLQEKRIEWPLAYSATIKCLDINLRLERGQLCVQPVQRRPPT